MALPSSFFVRCCLVHKKKLLLCLLAGKRSLVAYGVFYTSILNKKAAHVGRQPGLWIRGANHGPESVVAI